MSSEPERQPPAPSGLFRTTQWTRTIEAAGSADPAVAREGLERFCLEYQDAIRRFMLRQGCSESDARDLAQEFLYGHVLKKWDAGDTLLHRARRDIGRFRCFLSGALRHFLADRRTAAAALKRGAGKVDSLDEAMEAGLQPGAGTADDSGRQFDIDYARTLLLRAANSLRHCDQNLALLMRRKSQAEVATELGMSEGAVRKMHHDFRHRLGAAIREQVAQTVGSDPAEIEDELRYLQSLFTELQ